MELQPDLIRQQVRCILKAARLLTKTRKGEKKMTKFANKYNKKHTSYNYQFPEVPVYVKLGFLFKENGPDMVYPVRGLFINDKGNYGPQAVIATDSCMIVNLPQHMTAQVEEMQEDEELTQAINQGLFCFKIYEYTRKGETRKL